MERQVMTIDCTPGPAEIKRIIEWVRQMWRTGDHRRAFDILSAGWPHMKIGQAWRLLKGDIEIEEALSMEQ